jgi:ribosomal protein S18 acetylase RimI-like enzyme
MSSIEYHELTNSDYEDCIDLWKNSPGIALSPADSREEISQFLARNPGLCFTARNDNQLVGAVLCGNDGRRGYLYHLAVAKDYHHQGIGKALTVKVLNALREAGIQKCHIFVVADNLEGARFWQKTGWKKREDIFVMSHYL